jgi:16S rRNA processing protein RimM
LPQPLPETRLVDMGRISAPFGIKGWVRVQAYSGSPGSLTNYPVWWLNSAAGWQEYTVQQAQVQGPDVLAKLAGCEDRDAAAGLKGRVVAVPRAAFPPAQAGEYYWADLVGLRVRSNNGLDFGVVSSMLETGANAVMVVQQDAVGGERLIPFIAEVVRRVDIAAGVIEVEWGVDY